MVLVSVVVDVRVEVVDVNVVVDVLVVVLVSVVVDVRVEGVDVNGVVDVLVVVLVSVVVDVRVEVDLCSKKMGPFTQARQRR